MIKNIKEQITRKNSANRTLRNEKKSGLEMKTD